MTAPNAFRLLDQVKRLADHRCPIHGVGLAQTGLVMDRRGNHTGTEEGCPVRSCDFTVHIEKLDKELKQMNLNHDIHVKRS